MAVPLRRSLLLAAFERGKWTVLEPIMLVECVAPPEFHGQLLSSVTRRSGLIVDTDVVDSQARVVAEVSVCLVIRRGTVVIGVITVTQKSP